MISVTFPLPLVSTPNRREHWGTRARRARLHRLATALALSTHAAPLRELPRPCQVRLVRIARRRLDDDNLVAAFKAVRDEVARILKHDDASPDIVWAYDQQHADTTMHFVRIEIGAPEEFFARDTCARPRNVYTSRPTDGGNRRHPPASPSTGDACSGRTAKAPRASRRAVHTERG